MRRHRGWTRRCASPMRRPNRNFNGNRASQTIVPESRTFVAETKNYENQCRHQTPGGRHSRRRAVFCPCFPDHLGNRNVDRGFCSREPSAWSPSSPTSHPPPDANSSRAGNDWGLRSLSRRNSGHLAALRAEGGAQAFHSVSAVASASRLVNYGIFRSRLPRRCRALDYCSARLANTDTLVHASTPCALCGVVSWPLGREELGWRGYALPTLQKRLGALGASLVVGTMWSLWHSWPIATPGGGSFRELVEPAFFTWLTYELSNSMLMAWLYNSTHGSLPIAWASHVGLSLGQNFVDKHPIPFDSFVLAFCGAATLVVLLNGPRNLSRTDPCAGDSISS